MDQIFDQTAINMLPLPKGIMVSFCAGKDEGHIAAAYRTISFDDGRISAVTADEYMEQKFGSDFKFVLKEIDNPVTCFSSRLSSGELLCVETNGDAVLFDTDSKIKWKGNVSKNGSTVGGLTAVGRKVWISFVQDNCIVRFNSITMRSEIRIGGGKEPAFYSPNGMWLSNNNMIVCCSDEKKLIKIDLETYDIEDINVFFEPIHQYFSIAGYELVRVDSGIYLL